MLLNRKSKIINRELFLYSDEVMSLGERKILIDSHLSHFDIHGAQAYSLKDSNDFYCLIFSQVEWVRIEEIVTRNIRSIRNFEMVESFGIIKNNDGIEHFAVIMPMPTTISMYERIVSNGFENNKVISWLYEVFDALHILHEAKIIHGNINGSTVRVTQNDNIIISNCFLAPCGFKQQDLFETISRSKCHPYGKSTLDFAADYYALGVLLLEIISGSQLLLPETYDLIYDKTRYGSFSTLINLLKITIKVEEDDIDKCKLLYIAYNLLNDDQTKRWNWLDAIEFLNQNHKEDDIRKLVSQLLSNINRNDNLYDSVTYRNKVFFSLSNLALSMSSSWQDAIDFLNDGKIMRWLLQGEQFEGSVISSYNSIYITSSKYNINPKNDDVTRNEALLSCFISFFSHDDIVTFRGISFHITSLTKMLKFAIIEHHNKLITNILLLLNSGLLQDIIKFSAIDEKYLNQYKFINDHYKKDQNYSYLFYFLDQNTSYLLFDKFICFTPKDVISVINNHSIDDFDYVARNLLYFLTAKLHLTSIPSPKLPQGLTSLKNDRLISLLYLLAISQNGMKASQASQLICHSLTKIVLPLLKGVQAKGRLVSLLNKVKNKGLFSQILKVLNHKVIKYDYEQYQKAYRDFCLMSEKREALIANSNEEDTISLYCNKMLLKISVLVWLCTIIISMIQI